jgi:hypothetical protein
MPAIGDYNICISARDSSYVPPLENVSKLIDFLDTKMFLDGPDREDGKLVLLPSAETREWGLMVNNQSNVATLTPPIRKRYVNLLHSPTAPENFYKNYGELSTWIDNLMPRDVAFVASLGRGTRRTAELLYVPSAPGEERRWVQWHVLHILRGYHGIWDRVWDDANQTKMWELRAVKGFTLMLHCKVNVRQTLPPIDEYMARLQEKPDFQAWLTKVKAAIGIDEFEFIGEHTA